MSKSMFEYLDHARRFERLASFTPDEQTKLLMRSQAAVCYRLALKKAREDAPLIPLSPKSSA
jgi:hypothetical protein